MNQLHSNGHDDQSVVFSHPVGKYQVMRVLPNDPFTRPLFPKVYARAIEFIDRYNAETDKVWLGNLIFSNAYQQNNLLHVLVALDDANEIVCHGISYVANHESFGNYVQILQIHKDVSDAGIIEAGQLLIDDWTRAISLKVQMNATTDEQHERLFNRFGFKRWRILMRRNLDEVQNG